MSWRELPPIVICLILGLAFTSPGWASSSSSDEVLEPPVVPGTQLPPALSTPGASPPARALPRSTMDPRAAAARSPRSIEVPGHLIVKLTDAVEVCAEAAFRSPDQLDAAEDPIAGHLISTLRGLGIHNVDALFRSAQNTETLAQGGARIPLAALVEHHRQRASAILARRGKAVDTVDLPAIHHLYVLTVLGPRSGQEIAQALIAEDSVAWVEPVQVYSNADLLPDDPFVDRDGDGTWDSGTWGKDYPDQWALDAMGWGQVWEGQDSLWSDPARIGGGGITIAVIDTGVDHTHPDLSPNLWRDGDGNPGADFVDIDPSAYEQMGYQLVDGEDYQDPDGDPMDGQGHGTHVAGIAAAAANDGVGIAGVAWNATLLGVRAGFAVGFDDGSTTGLFETDDLSAAIVWAAEAGADILNLSWGGGSSEAIADAIAFAQALGALPIAAAGNGDTLVGNFSPANLPGVVSVGATAPNGSKAAFSNWGEELDLAAPGKDILSTRATGTIVSSLEELVGEEHIRSSGTSMSTPQVAGAAALVWSARPSLAPDQVVARLKGTATHSSELLQDRVDMIPLGAGTPQLLQALQAPPSAHAMLTSLAVDQGATETSNGNGSAEPGERLSLSLSLTNVWESMGSVRLELVSSDPYVEVLSGASDFSNWPHGLRIHRLLSIEIAPNVPRYHLAALQMRVTGEGFEQLVPLPLVVHGSRTQIVAREDYPASFLAGHRIASDASGRLVAVWNRFLIEEDLWQVMANLFDANGQPQGEPFLLHPFDALDRGNPQVAKAADGDWVAIWRTIEENAEGSFDFTLEVQQFDAAGQALGAPTVIRPEGESVTQLLDVAVDDSGVIAIAWWASSSGLHPGVRVALINPAGQQLGEVWNAETTSFGTHSSPALAFDGEGRLLVSWRAHLGVTPAGEHDINTFARLFDLSGVPLSGEIKVNEERSRFNLCPSSSGSAAGFVMTWDWCDRPLGLGGTGLCSTRGRRISSTGELLTAELVLEPVDDYHFDDVLVTMDDLGRFGVAWEACLPSSFIVGSCEIQAREFASDGTETSGLHRIDRLNPLHDPSLAQAKDGYFVTWDHSGFGPFDIEGQFFRPPALATGPCTAIADRLCLSPDRFEIEVAWKDFEGQTGRGVAQPLSDNSGYFSFFDPDNVEILIKVLDGRGFNGHWWVFYASLSNVEYQMTVRDTVSGVTRIYDNPLGDFASGGDVLAFPDSSAALEAPGVDKPVLEKAADTTLSLADGRFSVQVEWTDFEGQSGAGVANPLTDDSGAFWFFDPANVELVIKLVDGRGLNGHWWFFYGAMSNVAYTITVTDGETGAVREYRNAAGEFASRGDTQAF